MALMGWRPQPRFDKSIKAWICRHKGKKTYLGRDYAEACKRFARIVDVQDAGDVRTVGEAIKAWQIERGNDWTQYLLGKWFEFAGKIPLDLIIATHFPSYASWLEERFAPETTRKMLRYAIIVCRWCVEKGTLAQAPIMPTKNEKGEKLLKPIRNPKNIPLDEIAAAFARLPSDYSRRLLEWLLETGARPSEGRLLKWDEVHLASRICKLQRGKTSKKSEAVRIIPLTDRAIEILESTPTAAIRDGYVFLSKLKDPYTRCGLHAVLARAGISGVYALRHTRAQQLLESGVPIDQVAAWLGHAHGNLATVQVYVHVTATRLREIACSQERLLPLSPAAPSRPSHPEADTAAPRAIGRRTRAKSAKGRGREAKGAHRSTAPKPTGRRRSA